MNARKAARRRKTRETEINVALDLDGKGATRVSTGIAFFDHMLTLLAYHAGFDLALEAAGDLEVDQHHTVEDVGLCLGSAIGEALGDKAGIRRYGWSLLPMDEALCMVALDLSGRPHLTYEVSLPVELISDFDPTTVREFLQALSNQAGLTLHVRGISGDNPHHILEAVFKGLGRAFREAVSLEPGRGEVPSTKGSL
jgi:imidazoleglycerol-phosphate dehydratase